MAHDYNKAFEAAIKTAKDFDWDAVVPNMVYVWTGLAQAVGLRYYGIPGIDIPHTTGFNYIEPPEDQAWMRADEYDALIDDPTAFLYNVWLPRVSTEVSKIGAAFHLPEQPLLREGRHGDAGLLLRLRPADRAAAHRVRHGLGHRGHLQGAVRHPGRQAARLRRPDDGHARRSRTRCSRPARRSCRTCATWA